MKNISKLLAAVLITVLATAGNNNTAYASQASGENIISIMNTDTDQNSDENLTADGNTDSENTADEDSATNADDNMAEEEALTEDEGTDTYDEAPEGYEVYIDEQGQIYYIEKLPSEDSTEEDYAEEDSAEEDKAEDDNSDETDEQQAQADDAVIEDAKASDTEANTKSAASNKPSYSESDLRLLASLVYAEAGNQTYNGMLAVANVVLNRVKSSVYWHVNTIEEVIYDNEWGVVQFSVTKKSKSGVSILDKALKCYDTSLFAGSNPEAEKKAMEKAVKAAKAALTGENNAGGYLCFRVNNKSASDTKKRYPDYSIIDDHVFYRTK